MKKLMTSIMLGAGLLALGAASAWAETKVQLLEVITSPPRRGVRRSKSSSAWFRPVKRPTSSKCRSAGWVSMRTTASSRILGPT